MIESIAIILGILSVGELVVIGVLLRQNNGSALKRRLNELERAQEKGEQRLQEEIRRGRSEQGEEARKGRKELSDNLDAFSDTLVKRMSDTSQMQKNQLDTFSKQLNELTKFNQEGLEGVRSTVETKLDGLQKDNTQKLEQMRQTVDEKLHSTLEKRLNESFKTVSQQLDQVHQGLGEMQNLATGVGDLKRVLTNVKSRGTWGEIQLGNLLEQVLAPEQYEANVATRPDAGERVEFAMKLPGQDDNNTTVWLPIDAKFPIEDYQRVLEATENANTGEIEKQFKELEKRLKEQAKQIQSKYLEPPYTTDFAIMFLPAEGLYAEVLKRNGVIESLQRDYRVVIAGPTTIAAFLNSLQMGFRTLAIQKQTSQIWHTLGEVKTEFHRFGEILDKAKKKLDEAGNTIDKGSSKYRNIQSKLNRVDKISGPKETPEALNSAEEE